jgi:hypothetical protein
MSVDENVRMLSGAAVTAWFDDAVAFAARWNLSVLALAVLPSDDDLTLLVGPDDVLAGVLALVRTIRVQPPDPWLFRTVVDDG